MLSLKSNFNLVDFEASKSTKLKLDFKDSKYATGRRKTSIAKVWLKKGSGKIYVNGKLFSDYFADETHKMQITRPFEIINQAWLIISKGLVICILWVSSAK